MPAGGNILVVDPSAPIRRMLESHLSRRGHVVATCRDVAEAIELLERGQFDVLIAESHLGDVSGFDLLRQVRSNFASDIAVIITSTRDQPDRIMRALERGADDYLTKPISPAVAVARTEALLELKQSGMLESHSPGLLDLPRIDRTLREAAGGVGKLRAICDALRDGLEAERASVFRLDREAGELLTAVAHGDQRANGHGGAPLIRMSADVGLAGACLRLEHLLNIPDAYADERFNRSIDEETGFRTTSVLCLPLRGDDGELLGVAQVLNHHSGPFTAAEEVKARQLAPRCALALAEAFFEVDRELNLAATIVAQPGTATFLPTMLGTAGITSGLLEGTRVKPAEDFIGSTIGRYHVSAVLGTGSQGFVLDGEDELLERRVAIKLLGPDSARIPMLRRQFMQEARTMAQLGHPNTVAIHDVGDHEGALYLVMEQCHGGTSWGMLKRLKRIDVETATQIVGDACRGLSAAHRRGMIHRDIKPDNILLDEHGTGKLSDFGLVLAPNTSDHTGQDHIVGTPHYMSPEQCDGGLVDHRSDIYAMGATYYHLLTGQPPFPGSTDIRDVMRRHREEELGDPREIVEELPEDVSSIVFTAMAKLPGDRYQNASEMLRDLEAVLASLADAR